MSSSASLAIRQKPGQTLFSSWTCMSKLITEHKISPIFMYAHMHIANKVPMAEGSLHWAHYICNIFKIWLTCNVTTWLVHYKCQNGCRNIFFFFAGTHFAWLWNCTSLKFAASLCRNDTTAKQLQVWYIWPVILPQQWNLKLIHLLPPIFHLLYCGRMRSCCISHLLCCCCNKFFIPVNSSWGHVFVRYGE